MAFQTVWLVFQTGFLKPPASFLDLLISKSYCPNNQITWLKASLRGQREILAGWALGLVGLASDLAFLALSMSLNCSNRKHFCQTVSIALFLINNVCHINLPL